MPAYTTLASSWQTELERKVGASPYLELVYDPDGKNVSLTGKYSVFAVGSIKNQRDIDPVYGKRPSIAEIQVTCHDPDNYLNPESSTSPFHNAMGLLYAQADAGQRTILIDPGDVTFAMGKELTINDGTNSETVVVDSFTAGVSYHTIVIKSDLAHTYAADTTIYTGASEYKDMLLRLRISGCANWITLYWGKLLRIHHQQGQATFVITDRRKLQLDQILVKADATEAKKLTWMDTSGALESSVNWNSGSAGNLNVSLITVKDACRLGRWTFTFSSNTDYTVSGPGIKGETGETAVDGVTALSLVNATTGLNGASDVYVVGGYAYIASYDDDSLYIYDITDPASPVLMSQTTGAGPPNRLNGARALKVVGNYAYIVATLDQAIEIFDVSNVSNPVVTGGRASDSDLNGVEDIDVVGDYAYVVSATAESLVIFDISDVRTAVKKSTVTGAGAPNYLGGACSIRVLGDYAFIVSRTDNALTIFNVKDPTNPKHVSQWSTTETPNYLEGAQGIDIDNDYAYICGYTNDTLAIVDISNRSLPSVVGYVTDSSNLNGPRSVHVAGDYAYVTCEDGNMVSVVDVSDKENPFYVTKISGAGSPNYLSGARGIYVAGNYIYATAYTDDSLVILEITASDSNDFDNDQITIATEAWTGRITSGDSVTFCTGISWEETNPVQAVYDFYTNYVTVANTYLDCSSYFGNKAIGTLYEGASSGATAIRVKVNVPTLIKAGETLTITEGATTEEVTVATGVGVTASYPPYISLTVSALVNSYTHAATVTWKQRGSLDTDFSFDAEYSYCDSNSIQISITLERAKSGGSSDMTKQQALELLTSHWDGFSFQDNWGVEKLHSHRSQTTTPGTISYSSNLKLPDPELELRELVNKFRFKWGYDYENEEFLYETVYPVEDSTNRSYLRHNFIREVEVKLPGIFSSGIIDIIKENKFLIWENGVNLIRFSMTLQGIVAMIGDHFNFSSLYPSLTTEIEILGIEDLRVTGGLGLRLIGWDYGKVF